MKVNIIVVFLVFGCFNIEAMIPRSTELPKTYHKKRTPQSRRLQQLSNQLSSEKLKNDQSAYFLQQWLNRAKFINSIPTNRDYFKTLAQYIDYLNIDSKNKENIKLANQYKNELHIRATLTLANLVASAPEPQAENKPYFSDHKLLQKYQELEQQIAALNNTLYDSAHLSENDVFLAKLSMPLQNIWMDIQTFHRSWDRNNKLHNMSISAFKQDTQDCLRKIEFYRSVLAVMDTSGFGTLQASQNSFNFKIVDFIINTANYIDYANNEDIQIIKIIGNNKDFQSLFQTWIDKKLDRHGQKKEVLSSYNKIKRNIAEFPELQPTTLENLLSQEPSPILPASLRK